MLTEIAFLSNQFIFVTQMMIIKQLANNFQQYFSIIQC